MGRRTRVKINRAVWGTEVMSAPKMKAYLGGLGAQVAARVPGSSVEVTDSPVRGGGRRSRARITTSVTMREEADTGRAQVALRSVVPTAHRPR